MHSRAKTNSTSAVRHSNKRYYKRIYFNRKSCAAMFMSAALLLTSVDCMKVSAEELMDQVPPAETEATPENQESVSENTVTGEEEAKEPDYVRTEAGAVIIRSFVPLSEEESLIELDETEERMSLQEVTKLMPKTLQAKAGVNVSEDSSEGTDEKPGEGETQPPTEGEQPGEGEGETQPPTEGEQPGEGEGETQPPTEGEQPGEGEGETQPPTEGEQPGEGGGETQPPTEGEQPGEGGGEAQPPTEGEQPGEGGGETQPPTEGEQPGEGEGETQPPAEGEQPGEGGGETQPPVENQPGNGEEQNQTSQDGEQSGEGGEPAGSAESQTAPEEEQSEMNDMAKAEPDRISAAADRHEWRLLVAVEDDSNVLEENSGSESGDSHDSDDGDREAAGAAAEEGDGGTGDDTAGGDSGSQGDAESGDDTAGGDSGSQGDAESGDGAAEGGNGSQGDSESGDGVAEGGNGSQGDGGTGNGTAEGGDGNTGDGTGGTESDGSQEGTGAGGDAAGDAGDGENNGTVDGTGADNDTAAGEENAALTKEVDVEIPVQWTCGDDYENTELTEYTFRPTWDTNAWFYEADADDVPTILVSYGGEEIAEEVSTEEELAAAFAAGLEKITLKADIALTKTLMLPADAEIELDGQGYSLFRGTDENGIFIGTMIALDGESYTEETYGTLTMKNITVDGTTEADRAGAPVILNRGNLTLDEDAVVKDNFNYGTYPKDEDGETIADYGGGIQVQEYGCLTLTEKSLVTENFADEFGGGVYLANGATLYLYADVIRENSVSDDAGYGADLYAAGGSTIYYDASVDMEREGFYLCEGATLICMQDAEVAADVTDRQDDKVEIFISAADGSGYDDKYLERLTKKLESYGYSVIPKRAQIDTSDLRSWYVYDHYDTAAWEQDTTIEGSNASDKWSKIYGDNPRRKYYSFTEAQRNYENHHGEPVYTIADWLNRLDDNGYFYPLQTTSPTSSLYLAQFKEHIYSRGTDMTFVGYGQPAYIDFMYYDPQSYGEKVVDFDIDSSQVTSHALSGVGFLVNVGVNSEGKLNGYLIYYHYRGNSTSPGDNPTGLYVCKLEGIDVEEFHGGSWDLKNPRNFPWPNGSGSNVVLRPGLEIVKYWGIPENWQSQMSIRIQVSPTKIDIWQQPQDASTDIGETTRLSVDVTDSGYSGFGPLAAYTSVGHSCYLASCFTFSNVRMYYTNPTQDNQNMLQTLELADYTQDNTQKYFLNLFGSTDQEYNNAGVETRLYHEYLKLMQVEGVALITDRDTVFEDYLGKNESDAGSGVEKPNLCELGNDHKTLEVDELAEKIRDYIIEKHTTYIQYKLPSGGGSTLNDADPGQAVGNIWLESEDGKQVRDTLQTDSDSFPQEGIRIQIRDGIAYYDEGRDGYTVQYEVIKPSGETYSFTTNASDGDVPYFVVGSDPSDWPAGRYTVRQTIKKQDRESTVHGYAYFDVKNSKVPTHIHTWGRWQMDEEEHWHACEVCGKEKGDRTAHTWGEYQTVQKPTCTEPGRMIRTCTTCGKTHEEMIPPNGHNPKDEWSMDDTEHWHVCKDCGEKLNTAAHVWGKYETDQEASCTTPGHRVRRCTVCGRTQEENSDATGHSPKKEWSMDEIEHWHECEVCKERLDIAVHTWGEYEVKQEATCTEDGLQTRSCEICGAVQEETIPAKGHRFKEQWSINVLEHWHECEVCNAKTDVGFHRFGEWVTDEEAAEDKDGSRHRICADCGYKEFSSIIRGKITKREDCGEGAPQTAITTELPALALATLSEEDVHAVGNGTDVEIVLVVVDADNTVSAADREAVVSTARSYKLGQYFDMALYKEIKDGRSQVAQTGDAIRLTIEIPENIRKDNRYFAVARVHNGTADILQDLDSAASTVTIDTDRFSTYAFVYADPEKKIESGGNSGGREKKVSYPEEQTAVEVSYQSPKEAAIESPKEAVPESQRDSEPKTGQPIRFELYATIAFIQGASYLFFLFADSRGMTEETKTELVSRLIRWAKRGGRLRRMLALAAIFVLLVYYHSIGKQVRVRWMQACDE